MKRAFKVNRFPFACHPKLLFDLANKEYLTRFPIQSLPFSHCIVYVVVSEDKKISLKFCFPQDVDLILSFIHKRPGGAHAGEDTLNTDIREVTDIHIPNFEEKYFFDFAFFIFDFNTGKYWSTLFLTQEICPDLRFYLSKKRKDRYKKIGKDLAKKYNTTLILGHTNLASGKLRRSNGISKLISSGWIPTISLFPQPYGEMINVIEKENDLEKVNTLICKVFRENQFLEKILERWLASSLTKKRIRALLAIVDDFKREDYLSCIYVLLPQVEGLITDHIKRRGQIPGAKIEDRFKQFGDIINSETYNTKMTKYLTMIFIRSLKKTFYKTWYPYIYRGKAYRGAHIVPQRHLLLHGEFKLGYFTEANCIKLMCILDNIILLSLRDRELTR